ncbi:hypothetical protein J6590_060852, partial [Homalodisca vitripennis]
MREYCEPQASPTVVLNRSIVSDGQDSTAAPRLLRPRRLRLLLTLPLPPPPPPLRIDSLPLTPEPPMPTISYDDAVKEDRRNGP